VLQISYVYLLQQGIFDPLFAYVTLMVGPMHHVHPNRQIWRYYGDEGLLWQTDSYSYRLLAVIISALTVLSASGCDNISIDRSFGFWL
jgi:hypothetical protein